MRVGSLLLAALLVSSCSPRPGVKLSTSGAVLTPGYVDSMVRKAAADRRDAPRRYASDQANGVALTVDTIVARPDSLLLAVGDTVLLFGGPVSWVGRDPAGNAVPGFTPWFRVDNNRVAALRGDHLVALAAGRGALLLIVAVRSDSLPPRFLHTTRVPVVVR